MADNQLPKRPTEPGHRYVPRHSSARPVRHLAVDGFQPAVRRHLSEKPSTNVIPQAAVHAFSKPVLVPRLHRTVVHPISNEHHHRPPVAEKPKPALPRQRRSVVLKRQFVERAQRAKRQQRHQLKRQAAAFVFGGFAFIVVTGAAALGFLSYLQTPTTPKAAVLSTKAAISSTATSEVPPTPQVLAIYQVNEDQPRIISIPKLGVVARTIPVIGGFNGEPQPPKSIFDSGWLTASAAPGKAGVGIYNGRVFGNSKPGVFERVDQLKAGDIIKIERGDKQVFSYKVVRIQHLDAQKFNMQDAYTPAAAGKSGISLLSPGNSYNDTSGQPTARILISAVQD